ncbi:hypothetical protein JCM8097_003750 [Rhodosporidiobolus ruineniae]
MAPPAASISAASAPAPAPAPPSASTSANPTPSTSSSKVRKGGPGGAGGDGASEGGDKPAKRKRVSYSYDDPVDFLAEVRDRLDSIEGMVAALSGRPLPARKTSRHGSASARPPTSSPAPSTASLPPVSTASDAPPSTFAAGGPAPASPASSSSAIPPLPAEPQAGFVSERAGGRYFGSSASASVDDQGKVASLFQALSAPREGEERGQGDERAPTPGLVLGGGVPGEGPATAGEWLRCLPPRPLADFLTTFYFSEINLTRYPLSEPTFRTIYSDLFTLQPSCPLPPAQIHLLPLIFIVLAISALTAPPNPLLGLRPAREAPSVRRELAHSLYSASCRAHALSDATFEGRGNVLSVMSGVLVTRYLVLTRRASDGYEALGAAINRAFALGLHRRRVGLAPAEEETRRRIWSYLLHLDRYLCLLLGLPLTINEAFCDVPGPSNISDLDAVSVLPPTSLTTSTFLLLRHSLTKLMSRIALEAFGQTRVPYSTITTLEQALQVWQKDLPEFFRLVPYGESYPGTGSGGTASVLEVQRYLLSTEYRFIRTTLHRPYLASPDPAMAPSREACIQSALNDLWSRLTAYPLRGMENLSSGSYRVTLSIVVLGVAMLLSPSSDRAKQIRDCLISFASLSGENVSTPGGAASLVDEPSFREVAARELNQLKARITQPAGAGAATGAQGGEASGTSTAQQAAQPPVLPVSTSGSTYATAPEAPTPGSLSSILLPDPAQRLNPASIPLQPPTYPDIYSHAQTMLNPAVPQAFPSFPSMVGFPSATPAASTALGALDFALPDFGLGATSQTSTGLAGGTGAGAGEMDFSMFAGGDGGDINWDVFNDVLSSMGGAGTL